jgi:4-phytase/acid phosphatase
VRLALSAFFLLALSALAASPARADVLDPPPGMTVERVVMVFRHGVRAPLPGEAAAASYARQPWPAWSTPPQFLTPHGREAMRLLGAFDRDLFAGEALLPASGCPRADDVLIWTNVVERTIASGEALADGLAPGCHLAVGHLAANASDPLFETGATAAPFDAAAAIASVQAYTGGLDALVKAHRQAFETLEEILGCRTPGTGPSCDLASIPSSLTASADGRDLDLKGPIDLASGTAQVFLLQYAEGKPLSEVGWGRATPARIAEVSRLHALLFDVFDRSPDMAPRTAFAMGPRIVELLRRPGGARVAFLVGHDNNIAALTSLLQAPVKLEGYALDDPPPGGALGFQLLRQRRTGAAYVRVFYQSQSLEQMRRLTPLGLAAPPLLLRLHPACATGPEQLCSLAAVEAALSNGSGVGLVSVK